METSVYEFSSANEVIGLPLMGRVCIYSMGSRSPPAVPLCVQEATHHDLLKSSSKTDSTEQMPASPVSKCIRLRRKKDARKTRREEQVEGEAQT